MEKVGKRYVNGDVSHFNILRLCERHARAHIIETSQSLAPAQTETKPHKKTPLFQVGFHIYIKPVLRDRNSKGCWVVPYR